MKFYQLIIFNVRNTLVRTKTGDTFPRHSQDWEWIPGRREKLHELSSQGVLLAIAANEGGIAFGKVREADMEASLKRICEEGGIPMRGLFVCYTHPTAPIEKYKAENDPRRKPGPGMILEAMEAYHVKSEGALFVGERSEDLAASVNADVDFQWSHEFFPPAEIEEEIQDVF